MSLYAIVDIETTGGYAGSGKITEIAVCISDGERVVDYYETLLNPEQTVPGYITGLTGITQPMVNEAPVFKDIAGELHALLNGKIFVAHNVQFDYSFLKKAFEREGYLLTGKRLCTVRLSRQIFPGQRSYSLGHLCEALSIPIAGRHRAGGDVGATVTLFHKLLKQGAEVVRKALKATFKETSLPPHLPKEEFLSLPECPGVYYFINARGETIYVGKAIDLKKRVAGHFSGISKYSRNQYIRNEVCRIDYRLTGNNLIALVLESQEIKRLWPKYNRAQKRRSVQWGIYQYEDREGYLRLNLGKKKIGTTPRVAFNSHAEGFSCLINHVREFRLCPKLCGIQRSAGACFDVALGSCRGACCGQEYATDYNDRVQQALRRLQTTDRSFAIVGKGRKEEERSLIVVENGTYCGFGFCHRSISVTGLEDAKSLIDFYKPTIEIAHYIRSHINSPQASVVEFP